ncbi:hypothetical protein MMC10_011030 [Thelotrema lepadinum]|nr:hypothetical protein [Thelotrema lepadinum]
MKTAPLALSLIAAVNGFVITDCDNGKITNFGDDKCQIWTGNPFTYESDAGCTLYAYSEGNCQGSIFQTATQNKCQKAPDGIISVNCIT